MDFLSYFRLKYSTILSLSDNVCKGGKQKELSKITLVILFVLLEWDLDDLNIVSASSVTGTGLQIPPAAQQALQMSGSLAFGAVAGRN